MKRLWILILVLLTLCGCSREPICWETVTDDIAPLSPIQRPYAITISVPKELQDEEQIVSDTERIYGDCRIITKTFLADDYTSAVHQLTGYRAEELQIVQTARFRMPEYRFAWYDQQGETGDICRCDMVQDGSRYYAVIFAVQESAGNRFQTMAAEVFSTFGLHYPE